MDMLRIKKANKAVDEIEKKCRSQTTLAKKRLEDDYEAEEADNPSYVSEVRLSWRRSSRRVRDVMRTTHYAVCSILYVCVALTVVVVREKHFIAQLRQHYN
ncbi:hypothetical protein J6590_039777 [Homalodisca vitripennis]|nr:hypothetical protein J6590_039777 [Homalodisca vitripennis]